MKEAGSLAHSEDAKPGGKAEASERRGERWGMEGDAEGRRAEG